MEKLSCNWITAKVWTLAVALAASLSPIQNAGAFTAVGAMNTSRDGHTATLLPNNKVLIAGGYRPNDVLSSAELYDPTAARWTSTGGLNGRRGDHTATLLPNGKLLVAGGYDGTNVVASAELYDPATGTWSPTGPLSDARCCHTATLLPNGKVLVAGGVDDSNLLDSAELYDPATGTWTHTGPLISTRDVHTATLLHNGKVLVAGGYDNQGGFAAEVYDPLTGTWSSTGEMLDGRYQHTATLLPSGQVLVAGGAYFSGFNNDESLPTAEIYDPTTGTWTRTGSLVTSLNVPLGDLAGRFAHTATLLTNGLVLVTGGHCHSGFFALFTHISAELYDPATGTWTAVGEMTARREFHTATLLANGHVLIAGAYSSWSSTPGSSSAELYTPAVGNWTATGSLSTPTFGRTTLLLNGKVLRVGRSSAELYDPVTGTWSMTGAIAATHTNFTVTLLLDGKVLVAGDSTAELYDPVTDSWSLTGPMMSAHAGPATLLLDGRVLVADGSNPEIYDPASGQWTPTAALHTSRQGFTANLLLNGKVLIAGGSQGTNRLATAELYDPENGTWALTGPLTTRRNDHTASLLPNGKVLAAGGWDGTAHLSVSELYDPATATWTPTSPMALRRGLHTATVLQNGHVLVAGGLTGPLYNNPQPLPSASLAEAYNPITGGWEAVRPMNSARAGHSATLLPNGQVLVTGGVGLGYVSLDSAELLLADNTAVPAAPVTLANARTLPDGAFRFDFTSAPATRFTVLATTNSALPLGQWVVLGGIAEVSTGRFLFTDTQAGNYSRRLYRVRSP